MRVLIRKYGNKIIDGKKQWGVVSIHFELLHCNHVVWHKLRNKKRYQAYALQHDFWGNATDVSTIFTRVDTIPECGNLPATTESTNINGVSID